MKYIYWGDIYIYISLGYEIKTGGWVIEYVYVRVCVCVYI